LTISLSSTALVLASSVTGSPATERPHKPMRTIDVAIPNSHSAIESATILERRAALSRVGVEIMEVRNLEMEVGQFAVANP
jgi:hypothetical protein